MGDKDDGIDGLSIPCLSGGHMDQGYCTGGYEVDK